MSESVHSLPLPLLQYRGKKLHNFEWVYGLLVALPAGDRMHAVIQCQDPFTKYQVFPSSLGVCTGRKDKTGKDIFSNDAIKIDSRDTLYKVFWHERGTWGVTPTDSKLTESFVWIEFIEIEIETCATIVGNLNDTPELFKTEDE